jgi:hypothetical protein
VPLKIDPDTDYRRLAELSGEFTELWERLHAFYLDSVIGFSFVRSYVESEQAEARAHVRGTECDSEEFQDTRMFLYDNLIAQNFCIAHAHRSTQAEAKGRNVPTGHNFTTLGQLCVSAFYDFWNDYLRREYVIAKGKLDPSNSTGDVAKSAMREHASFDIWGDLYYLRTAIVHNQGTATEQVEKSAILKWFKRGEPIVLSPEHMRIVFLKLLEFRNALHAEQFPEQYIVLEG